jgi:hypothetical protein
VCERFKFFNPENFPEKNNPENFQRFQLLRGCSGDTIDMGTYSNQIDSNITVGWLLPVAASRIAWPPSYVQLEIEGQVFAHSQLVRARSKKLLKDFDSRPLNARVIKLPPPVNFAEHHGLASTAATMCICDFDGCCLIGRETCTHIIRFRSCDHCGKNGTCQAGTCGHSCCESHLLPLPPELVNDHDNMRCPPGTVRYAVSLDATL